MQSNDLRQLNQFVLESLLLDHVHAALLLHDHLVGGADLVTVGIAEVSPEPDRRREEGARVVAVDLVEDLHEEDHLCEEVDPEALEGHPESDLNQNHVPNLHDVVEEVNRVTDAEGKDLVPGQFLDRLVVARRDRNRDLNLAQHRQARKNHRDDQGLVHPIVLRPRKRRKIKTVNAIKTRTRIRTRKKIRKKIRVRKKKRRKKNKKMKRNRTTKN